MSASRSKAAWFCLVIPHSLENIDRTIKMEKELRASRIAEIYPQLKNIPQKQAP